MQTKSKPYSEPATDEQIEVAARNLRENKIEVLVVETGSDAFRLVLELVPAGAEVYSGKSKTLEDLGIFAALHESGNFDSVRNRYLKLDRATQGREIRKLMGTPDVMLGSVHALTEDGELVTASYSGSQVAAYAYGGGRVILVVGSQKLVRNLDEAMSRIREHVFPYEDHRLREAVGIGTKAAKILIHSAEAQTGRTTVILVKEPVGV
jgi:hypothetical protein